MTTLSRAPEVEEPALEPRVEPGNVAVIIAFGVALLVTVAWVVFLVALASRILASIF